MPPLRVGVFLQDVRAGDIARQQVGRALDAIEAQPGGLGQRVQQEGLRRSRRAFQQGVAAGKYGYQHLFDRFFVSNDYLGQVRADAVVGRFAVR